MIGALRRVVRRAYQRWIAWADGQPRRAAGLLFLASLPALYLAVLFFSDVRAGLEELLPRSAPSVRALEEIHRRIGGKAHLSVIAQSTDKDQNRRFIDEICGRLKARKVPEIRSLQCGVTEERRWIRDHAPMLIPKARFDELADEIEAAIDSAKAQANPMFVDLGDNDPAAAWRQVEARLDEEVAKNDRFRHGYFETPDGLTVVNLIWLEGTEVDVGPSARLLGAVQEEVAAIRGRYSRDLVVAYNGEVPNLIEEHDAILADLSLSSLVVFLLVGSLIIAYFRSWRGVATTLFALTPGLIASFAIGRLTVGHLNSNTAFLGSIIAGNGINYPLLFLAYYRQRPLDELRATALYAAARGSLPGSIAAAATASAAYGGLTATDFRGFSQFGWLGGIGMITVWIVTFLAMPVAITLFDPPRQGTAPTRTQRRLLAFFNRRRLSLSVSAIVVVAALVAGALGVRRALQDGLYEMDLQTMRNRDSLAHGAASWDGKMSELFGVWLNPVVGLVEDPASRESLAGDLRRALTQGDHPVAERVETIAQFVPAPDDQAARLERLGRLAAIIDKVPEEQIPEKARPLIRAWLAKENRHPITDRDVPAALRLNFTETNGRTDRVVLVFPSLRINYNDGRNILAFVDQLNTVKPPADAVIGGAFLFMAEVIRLVRDQAAQVTLVVCLLVALVLVPAFLDRPLRVPLAVLLVVAVALASQAVMFALGVRLNMLNFAAVPITIGVGADYIVNLMGAMESFETDARHACARMGGAILLCSLTTTVGYISLVMAQSGALRTFGWSAVLGEIMAVIVVLVVVPTLWRSRGAASAQG